MPANHMGDTHPAPEIRGRKVHDPDFTVIRTLDGHIAVTEPNDYDDCDLTNPHTP